MWSIKNQTHTNWELIISDDESTDCTLDIINDFIKTLTQKVTIVHHKRNGLASNWNNCVKNANGEFIKFVFQDDLIEPNCLEVMLNSFHYDKNIGLVFSRRTIIFNKNEKRNVEWMNRFENLHDKWHSHDWKNNKSIKGKKLLKDNNLFFEPINKIGEPTAVMIRKSCFEKVGYFRNDLYQLLDWEFWMRIMTKYNIVFIDEPLVSFRLHDKQESANNEIREIPDYKIWNTIIYNDYFYFLNWNKKVFLFKSKNEIYSKIKKLFCLQ